MSIRIMKGDARQTLSELPNGSVHLSMSSPPYWLLRAYLPANHPDKSKEIGSEATPDAFIENLMTVYDQVRRVLRDDGVCVVNMGETWAGGGRGGNPAESAYRKQATNAGSLLPPTPDCGIPAGNVVGIPYLFAFAMRDRGWVWRDSIVWCKPSAMPASLNGWRWARCRVHRGKAPREHKGHERPQGGRSDNGKDFASTGQWSDCPGCPKCEANDGLVLKRGSLRSTTSHEYLLVFSKGMGYYGDRNGWATPAKSTTLQRNQYTRVLDDPDEQFAVAHDHEFKGTTANQRSVLTVGPQSMKQKHYASYPEALCIPFIKAFTSEKGCCPTCGAPWARVVDVSRSNESWRPTCTCEAHDPIPCTVLDPFGGTCRTAIAAKMLGRDAVCCELNDEYIDMAKQQFSDTAPLLLGGGH